MTSSVGHARTFIVDDHPLFRQTFGEVLARQPEFEVVADVGSVADAIAYVSHHVVDAAIVDIVLISSSSRCVMASSDKKAIS